MLPCLQLHHILALKSLTDIDFLYGFKGKLLTESMSASSTNGTGGNLINYTMFYEEQENPVAQYLYKVFRRKFSQICNYTC